MYKVTLFFNLFSKIKDWKGLEIKFEMLLFVRWRSYTVEEENN